MSLLRTDSFKTTQPSSGDDEVDQLEQDDDLLFESKGEESTEIVTSDPITKIHITESGFSDLVVELELEYFPSGCAVNLSGMTDFIFELSESDMVAMEREDESATILTTYIDT